jgi:hypothetical protein
MRFLATRRIPGALAHASGPEGVLISRRYQIDRVQAGGRSVSIGRLPVRRRTQLLTRLRPAARALRLGCSLVATTPRGTVLAVADKKIFRKGKDDVAFRAVQTIERGSRPLHRGLCVNGRGFVFWGEYFGNSERGPVHIFGSEDDGLSFASVHVFPARAVRHVHGIQEDSYTGDLWIMTGDDGEEASIYRADPQRLDVSRVGGGNQSWRCVSLVFTPAHVYWGTDSPSEQNYIIRYERRTGSLTRLQPVGGPVYYSTQNEAGHVFFGTTVEPTNEFVGPRAQVWCSDDGDRFQLLCDYPKDSWNATLFQFGTLQFPAGVLPGRSLWVSGSALKDLDNQLIIGEVTT